MCRLCTAFKKLDIPDSLCHIGFLFFSVAEPTVVISFVCVAVAV